MTKVTPIPGDDQRTDLALLREHGIEVSQRTRELLWLAIDMHDITRDAWATMVMRRAIHEGQDPIAALRHSLLEWVHVAHEQARRWEGLARWEKEHGYP